MTDPRLNLLVIRSGNLPRCAAFYECLGIRFREEQHGGGPLHVAADFQGIVLEIYPAPRPEDVDRSTRLGFGVGDLVPVLQRLTDAGAEVQRPPRASPWGLRAVVRDPDGRSVELTQLTT